LYTNYSNEIESKEEKLRQVVGDSYRDLISSADAIESIAEQCEQVSKTLEDLVGLIRNQKVLNTASGDVGVSRGHDEEVFSMASCVKFIVDSQEAIYGHVDREEYLMAAVRYLRAVEMHRKFEKSEKHEEYARKFPFLEHMWPSVKKLDRDIWNKGQSWLSQRVSVCGDDVAGVLACFSLLRPVDGMDLLKYFLTARHDSIVSKITASNDSSLEEKQDLIASMAQNSIEDMWNIICIVFDLFSEQGPGPIQKLLEQSSTEGSHDSKSSWFWRRVEDATSKLQSSTSQGSLQLESEEWLLRTSNAVKKSLEPWLLSVDTCCQLKEIDARVQECLSKWTGVVYVGKQPKEMTVVGISKYATGNIMNLWDLTCQSLLVARAKTIVKNNFLKVEDVSNCMVDDMLMESKQSSVTLYNPLSYPDGEDTAGNRWWVTVSKKRFLETESMLEGALREAMDCLKIGEKASLENENGIHFEEFISNEFGSMIKRIMSTLDTSRSSQTAMQTVGISLTIVHFTSLLLHSCSSFEKFLHFQELESNDANLIDLKQRQMHPWARETLKTVKIVRESANIAWATWCSNEIAAQVCGKHDPLKYCDDDQNVPVPTFPSKWLTDAVSYFCAELDQSGGVDLYEDLVKQAMTTFKATMVSSSIRIEKSSPTQTKQGRLQRIYDMKFISVLFWEDKAISAPMKEHLQSLIDQIDPVEWTDTSIELDHNVLKYASNAASLLRLRTQNVSLAKGSNTEHDVSMDMATSQSRFAYLPAKLPSKSQIAPSYTIPATIDADDSLKGQGSSISSSAQTAISSLLGSKAAEVGGLLGSFNFPSFTTN
jgi:hypothetical protein